MVHYVIQFPDKTVHHTSFTTIVQRSALISNLSPGERCQICFKPFVIEELPPDPNTGYSQEQLQEELKKAMEEDD